MVSIPFKIKIDQEAGGEAGKFLPVFVHRMLKCIWGKNKERWLMRKGRYFGFPLLKSKYPKTVRTGRKGGGVEETRLGRR